MAAAKKALLDIAYLLAGEKTKGQEHETCTFTTCKTTSFMPRTAGGSGTHHDEMRTNSVRQVCCCQSWNAATITNGAARRFPKNDRKIFSLKN